MSIHDLRPPADRPAEVLKVGQSYGIYRKDNQALVLVNATAMRACLSAFPAIDTSDVDGELADAAGTMIPPQEADALIGHLAAAGFLDGPSARVSTLGRSSRVALTQTSATVYGLAAGVCARLVCNDPQLDALLAAALEPLRVSSAALPATEIHAMRSNEGYAVSRDGIVIAADVDLAMARRMALQTMAVALQPPGRAAAFVHASTVVLSGKAMLLAGATGSGKTTLMMALIGAGAHYVADDLSPLDVEGCAIAPYPLAASIKSGSWEALVREFPDLMTAPVHRVGNRRVRYLDPACGGTAWSAPAPIGALVFPRYRPGAQRTTARISAEEGLDRLLHSGSEVVGHHASLRPLARLADRVPCWEMSFPDLASGCDAMADIARWS